MANKVLLVDDDEHVLQGYYRVLRQRFQLEVALGGLQAIQALESHGPFAVLVADMRMPGMSGLELLQEARNLAPDTVRIMLTGNLDQETAVDSVNHGQVFRFLTKPCDSELLALAIQAGLRQHQLLAAERELLENTLRGCIHVLSEVFSNLDPVGFGRAQVLRERIVPLAQRLRAEDPWSIEMAALLAPLGRITLPPEQLAKLQAGTPVEPDRHDMLDRIPEVGGELLRHIPRMEEVARIVRYQAKGFDGSGFPIDPVEGPDLPLGARLLRALADFTEVELSRCSRLVAVEELSLHRKFYDPVVLAALFELFGPPDVAEPPRNRQLRVSDLEAGMVLPMGLRTRDGRLVMPPGMRISPAGLQLLRNLGRMLDFPDTVTIRDE